MFEHDPFSDQWKQAASAYTPSNRSLAISTAFTGVRYHPDRLRKKDGSKDAVRLDSLASNMPITTEELVDDAVRAYIAGSRYMHLHARNPLTGRQTGSAEDYKNAYDAIRDAVPGVLLSGPTSRKEEVGDIIKSQMVNLRMLSKHFVPHEVAMVEMNRAFPAIQGGADFLTIFTEPDILNDTALDEFKKELRSHRDPRRWPTTILSYFKKLCAVTREQGIRHELEITHLQSLETLKKLAPYLREFGLGGVGNQIHAVVLLGFSKGLPIERQAFNKAMKKLTKLSKKLGVPILVSVGAVIRPNEASEIKGGRSHGQGLEDGKHDYREVIEWVVDHNKTAESRGVLPVSIFRTGLEDAPVMYGVQQTNASLAFMANHILRELAVPVELDINKVRAMMAVDPVNVDSPISPDLQNQIDGLIGEIHATMV